MHAALYSSTTLPARMRPTAAAAAISAAWPLATPEQLEARELLRLTDVLAQPLDHSQLTDLGMGYHAAMLAITTGAGSDNDACTLACCSNVAMVLAERGWGDGDNLDTIIDAQHHLVQLRERGTSTGRYLLTGPGIMAINAMLTLHDQQLASADLCQAEIMDALREVSRRMNAGHVLTGGAA